MTIIDEIKKRCEIVLVNEPMHLHTSFKIGGTADILAFPKTTEELISVWNFCRLGHELANPLEAVGGNVEGIPFTVLGDGANVLVSDDGIRGVVVFTNKMRAIEILDCAVRAESGVRLAALAESAAESGLTGLEFSCGIPGTVGGAVYMNAGAYGHDISEFIETVTLFSNGEIIVKTGAEMEFGYRKSFAQGGDMLILGATFRLSHEEPHKIREVMADLNARRRKTQPLEYGSAGSFFKRPEGHFAGKLIEDAGLKGFCINDAQVSEKHAGFVVNRGNATSKDVLALMHHVQSVVFERYGVRLEPEVRILG
ncbi:MAG: UDP-N-acetylmuramate dehydrogenase [Defluviitaleaceae bacterium]|nr:UDP-N-acetylmuramate dehydrogenase [Defluviitaleaceae bacterium]